MGTTLVSEIENSRKRRFDKQVKVGPKICSPVSPLLLVHFGTITVPDLTIFVGAPGFLASATLQGDQGEFFADAQGQHLLGNFIFNCFPAGGNFMNCNNLLEFTNEDSPTFLLLPEFFDPVSGTGKGPISGASGKFAGVVGHFVASVTDSANVQLDLYYV